MGLLLRRTAGMVAGAACLATPPPAGAITNGAPDEGRHPAVGALVSHDGRDRKKHLICSGTLIAPTVFLTAAHCLGGEPSSLYVSFDAFVGAPAVGPEVTLYRGTAVRHPLFVSETAPGDTHDIAVVQLDAPVPGVAPVPLAREGELGPNVNGPELVGYGREGYDGKRFFGGGGRRFATGSFAWLEPFKLHLDQSGTLGGTCNGDSGGPVLLQGRGALAAITSDGDPLCQATGIYYRVDTPSARAFLGRFVTLDARTADLSVDTALTPASAPPVVGGRVATTFRRAAGRVRVARLRVDGVTDRTRITVSSPAFGRLRTTGPGDLAARLRAVRLAPGTSLRLRIAAPGHRSRSITWVVTERGAIRARR